MTASGGSLVDVTIRRAQIVDAQSTGMVTIRIIVDDKPYDLTLPPNVEINSATPVGWPPQIGDLWRTESGYPDLEKALWYAHRDAEIVGATYPDGVVLTGRYGAIVDPAELLVDGPILIWRDGVPV